MIEAAPLAPESDDLARTKRGLLIGRAYFFVFYGALANFVAFINVHLQNQGISGTQIGVINAITFVVAIFSPPLFGAIADRWHLHKAVLVAAGFLVGACALLFLGVSTFGGVLLAMMLVSIFRAPIPGVIDATVMGLVRRANTTYGAQRIWGGVGWAISSYATGLMVARLGTSAIFWTQFLLMGVLSVVLALLLPVERTRERVEYGAGLRNLTRLPQFRGILVLMFTMGIGANAYLNFGGLYLFALGGAAALVGLAFTASTLTEIPSMFFADRWIYRVGLRNALIIAAVGYGFSWLLVVFVGLPIMIPIAAAVSGIFTGIFWSAMSPYTLQQAPRNLGTTAINLGGAAFSGAGFAVGALVGGFLFDTLGGWAIFLTSVLVVWAGAGYFAWSTRSASQ